VLLLATNLGDNTDDATLFIGDELADWRVDFGGDVRLRVRRRLQRF
jgi:hypothetical protein